MTTTPTTERDDGEIEVMARAYGRVLGEHFPHGRGYDDLSDDEIDIAHECAEAAARDALDAYRASHAPRVEAAEYAELIGRLHARVRNTSTIGIFKSDGFKEAPDADCVEAATAIETLLADLARVTAERDGALNHLATAKKVIEDEWAKVCGPNMQMREAAAIAERDAAQSALAVARGEVEVLREALKPFSKTPIGIVDATDNWFFDRDEDSTPVYYQTHGWPRDQSAQVTAGDFRRARSALARTSPQPKDEGKS